MLLMSRPAILCLLPVLAHGSLSFRHRAPDYTAKINSAKANVYKSDNSWSASARTCAKWVLTRWSIEVGDECAYIDTSVLAFNFSAHGFGGAYPGGAPPPDCYIEGNASSYAGLVNHVIEPDGSRSQCANWDTWGSGWEFTKGDQDGSSGSIFDGTGEMTYGGGNNPTYTNTNMEEAMNNTMWFDTANKIAYNNFCRYPKEGLPAEYSPMESSNGIIPVCLVKQPLNQPMVKQCDIRKCNEHDVYMWLHNTSGYESGFSYGWSELEVDGVVTNTEQFLTEDGSTESDCKTARISPTPETFYNEVESMAEHKCDDTITGSLFGNQTFTMDNASAETCYEMCEWTGTKFFEVKGEFCECFFTCSPATCDGTVCPTTYSFSSVYECPFHVC